MCGICGFIKFDKKVSDGERLLIEKMNSTLVHRGPDAQDTLVFDNVALGFTRLSIIGLSDGMQPLFNEDESIVLICNGEIFNYIELRKELQAKGHVFKTSTDVEVIIHLYEEEGIHFLNKLNGQFAFALYDKRRKQMFCVRDQLGIIPLFYTLVENTFIFGSEIKAILEHPQVKRQVDTVGLDQVFTFAGLISPRTMFKGIKSLENGHYLVIDDHQQITDVEYWDLIYPMGDMPMNGKPEQAYVDELETIFEESINLRLRADVPSGLYVSGGLDSSMIALKVSKMFPGVAKEAFSIDFTESLHSESVYQKIVAKESNAVLNQKIFYFEDISKRLRHSVYHSECPIKETYNTASLCLSEAVRAKGIKVILSGEGADEFFAGYVGYRFDKMREMNLIQNSSSHEEKILRNRLWGDSDFFYERNFLEFDEFKKGIYSDHLASSFDEFNCLNNFVINAERIKGRNNINKRAYIDYKIRLVDHLVSDHGDRMAMANSVEVRYPFLDKKLIEFSAQLPADLKLNDFTEKYILRRMSRSFLPSAVLEREKFHFIAPGSPYLLQNKSEYINDLLSYDRIKRQGFFNPDKIEELKKTYSQPGFTINAPYESDILITVITFGILQEVFFES
ncbi:asparagine synthase (glutamine-hydrolyzing) [Pedobacter steynii]|uniref:asparagine synthase (glutamine-hydrolyzing) n=1 Tax=Pedobacter steynii TaxID=430522 RepID=A0A1D7QNB5_9SPHI|nr:asparagine synthase (glutamine-hydrolyzing) [Pedobacter steynii]AOM80162.1 asparagine synthase (glutamine-hydrolyzing) [Pedobacter steynii]